ncbi:hypothetical protein [Sulfurimonas sp.]|uniref:hypothetical protein n=1 Tax=Sulfurimonas sp. TaxID=2022749 RepID=UPI0025F40A1F|nr:hypothetical protein [Sulfurimonas sp.]MCK9455198.1 hypothetical protein [Sulfurimonas sp.]
MRTTTRSKSKVTIFLENVIFTYRKIDSFTHISGLYIAIAIVPIAAFLLAAQLNFANHRYEVDLTVLPLEKQERFWELSREELKMYAHEEDLAKNLRLGSTPAARNSIYYDIGLSSAKRLKLKKEMFAILGEAPYSSWGYKLFNTFGLVDNKNRKIAAIQKG